MIDVGRVAAIREHARQRARECVHPSDEVVRACWEAFIEVADELHPLGRPKGRRRRKVENSTS
jgi:hypothetical protein